MRGFPKHLNTPQDIENIKDLYPKETTDYLQCLADARLVWRDAGLVDSEEVVIETDILKVVKNETEAGIIERRKLVLVEDPTAQFFKLGLNDWGKNKRT